MRDVAIDVAGVSIAGASGRMRGDSQVVIENATITISPAGSRIKVPRLATSRSLVSISGNSAGPADDTVLAR